MNWHCDSCGEAIEDSLDFCWSCGTDRLGNPDSEFVHADSYISPLDRQTLVKRFRFSIRSMLLLTAIIGAMMAVFRSEPLVLVILAVPALPLAIFWLMLFLYSVFYSFINRKR